MIFKLTIKRLLNKKLYTSLIILALSLSCAIFITFSQSISEYKRKLSSISDNNVLVLGGTQGHLKTIFNSLYFKKGFVKSFKSEDLTTLSQFGKTIPIFNHYTAHDYPVIGLSSKYFELKGYMLTSGNMFVKIGQCIIGAQLAKQLNLSVGDKISSDADAGFDVNKSIPVRMTISGILEVQNSPVDLAVFTDLKTAWTMHGIGHEHSEEENSSQSIVDFTKGPLKNFHFHGEEDSYPLTSALLFTKSNQSKAELQALAVANKLPLQVINPENTLLQINESITGVNKFFHFLFFLILTAMLIILLVFTMQSSSIRYQEKITYSKLGVPSSFYKKLLAGEWIVLICSSLALGYVVSILLQPLMARQISLILAG